MRMIPGRGIEQITNNLSVISTPSLQSSTITTHRNKLEYFSFQSAVAKSLNSPHTPVPESNPTKCNKLTPPGLEARAHCRSSTTTTTSAANTTAQSSVSTRSSRIEFCGDATKKLCFISALADPVEYSPVSVTISAPSSHSAHVNHRKLLPPALPPSAPGGAFDVRCIVSLNSSRLRSNEAALALLSTASGVGGCRKFVCETLVPSGDGNADPAFSILAYRGQSLISSVLALSMLCRAPYKSVVPSVLRDHGRVGAAAPPCEARMCALISSRSIVSRRAASVEFLPIAVGESPYGEDVALCRQIVRAIWWVVRSQVKLLYGAVMQDALRLPLSKRS